MTLPPNNTYNELYIPDAVGNIVEANKNADLIILIAYINVGNVSEERAKQRMHEFKHHMNEELRDVNKTIKTIFIATNESTRVECVYPPAQIINQQIETKTKI